VRLSVPVTVAGAAGGVGWARTGRTRDVRTGGAAVSLDDALPPGVEEGASVVLWIDWEGPNRHLARVARVTPDRTVVALMILKPAGGDDDEWADAVHSASAAG
jgi:hypothetical protein